MYYFSNLAHIPQRACCAITYFVVKTKINLGHYLSLQVAAKEPLQKKMIIFHFL